MPKYNVTIVKPVLDYLRATVEIEAATEQEALEVAEAQEGDIEFEYFASGGTLESTTYEAEEIT